MNDRALYEAIDAAYRGSESPDWDDVLRRAGMTITPSRTRARRRRLGFVGAFVLGFALCAGIAIAAVKLLGEPAPPAVQARLAPFLMQEGLKPGTARVVAVAPDATLYGVRDKQGASCAEMVGGGDGLLFALQCSRTLGSRVWEVVGDSVNAVVTDGGGVPPVAIFGQLPPSATSARARFADGQTAPVEIGLDGFYVYEPDPAHQQLARRAPFTIEALNAKGEVVASRRWQPPQPLRTLGTPPHLVSGTVAITGARWVRVRVLDSRGSELRDDLLPLPQDGRFTWTSPPQLRGYYSVEIEVLDAHGIPLATARALDEQQWRQLLAELHKKP